MLITESDPVALSAFSLTALERQPKRALVLPYDLGIPISLLNTERWGGVGGVACVMKGQGRGI